MDTLLNNLLLSLPLRGLLWCLLLFVVCLFGVHFTMLARLGMEYCAQQKQEPKKEEKEKPTPAEKPAQEPIYYIVERKQRRTKPSYGEPKEIRFKSAE